MVDGYQEEEHRKYDEYHQPCQRYVARCAHEVGFRTFGQFVVYFEIEVGRLVPVAFVEFEAGGQFALLQLDTLVAILVFYVKHNTLAGGRLVVEPYGSQCDVVGGFTCIGSMLLAERVAQPGAEGAFLGSCCSNGRCSFRDEAAFDETVAYVHVVYRIAHQGRIFSEGNGLSLFVGSACRCLYGGLYRCIGSEEAERLSVVGRGDEQRQAGSRYRFRRVGHHLDFDGFQAGVHFNDAGQYHQNALSHDGGNAIEGASYTHIQRLFVFA